MAMTDGPTTPAEELEKPQEVDHPRDAWLEVAAADMDGGALAALATAARHGRPLPRD